MSRVVRTTLKTGKRPAPRNITALKTDAVLFEEGTTGKELYIIQEGSVGVYKNTPDGEVELATIEKGGIIGEMSLLDNLPRSATVKAKTDTKALLINPAVFHATMQQVPVWLSSIVKIVVSRLRDANKRIDMAILRDKHRGVVSLLLLLLPCHKYEFASSIALSYSLLLGEAFYVCRLKRKEIETILNDLARRAILALEEDTGKNRHICIPDLEILKLFEEYLILKSQGKSFPELTVPREAIGLFNNIAYVAQKSGSETEEGTLLGKSALLEDMSDSKPEVIEKNLLELKRRNLINVVPDQFDVHILFKRSTLSRLKKLQEWLPRFESHQGGSG
ncbi:MAG: cyclic nucleotide-binding domain-containing protein [Chitinivibrionales bacterium]|nr:cyclic nucleotide-binding domain-containing protein [Chitinivibrionales bacterium]